MAAERDRLEALSKRHLDRAQQAEAQREAALQRAQAVEAAARQIAAKAAKAERHPFATVVRRLGYGIAKGLATAPGIRRSGLGRASARVSAKHSPKRYLRLLVGHAPLSVAVVGDPGGDAPLLRGRHYLAFDPAGRDGGGATADGQGVYRLSAAKPGHTYVLPRRPDDLDRRIAALGVRPRFSIILPTYNTPPALLEAALASVLAQWYEDWEVVIADDASPEPGVQAALRALDDPRLHVLWLKRNGGISAATNAALAEATGDYVVFLDHDDELTPDCLWELAQAIDQGRGATAARSSRAGSSRKPGPSDKHWLHHLTPIAAVTPIFRFGSTRGRHGRVRG